MIDEQEIFGKHVSAILRRFTPRQQAQARLRTEHVLVDIEFPEEVLHPLTSLADIKILTDYQN